MTSEQLKNSILQFAVQGKLVPQNRHDEPASELLKKIKVEKEQLIKEKGIKKRKAFLPITEEEKPFEIPDSWEWVRLMDISSKISDGSHNPPPNSLKGIPILSATNIYNNEVNIASATRWVTEIQWESENKRTNIEINDVLLTIVGTIGRTAIVKENLKFALQRSVCVIKPILVNSYFISWFLQSPISIQTMTEKAKGTAQVGIYLNTVNELLFPLPPLSEQQLIVDKIEELMPLVEQYGTAESELRKLNTKFPEQLRKSVLQYAVQGKLIPQNHKDEPASLLLERIIAEKKQLIKEKKIKQDKPLPEIREDEIPFEIPNSWVWVRLNDLTSKIGSGSTPTGGKAVYLSEGIKFIRSQNVYNDGLRLNNIAYISEKTNQAKKGSIVLPDDILLNITGASIGRCAIVPSDFDTANINQHVMIIRLIDKSIIKYLHFCMTSTYIQSKIMDVQVGVSREGLSATKLMEFLIPVPPLSEQKLIVKKVEEVLSYCDKLK